MVSLKFVMGEGMIADKPIERLASLVPTALILLGARLTVANQFWKSGRAKVEGWNVFDLKDGAYMLFQNEYSFKTPFGDIYLPFPDLWAHAAAIGEHLFPALLVLGLASRFAALGLLAMTIVIQLIYPGAWLEYHLWWAVLLLIVMRYGAGALSLDQVIRTIGNAKS
ncbi:MAG: DoxX family protein [Parvularculaceae bacterium]